MVLYMVSDINGACFKSASQSLSSNEFCLPVSCHQKSNLVEWPDWLNGRVEVQDYGFEIFRVQNY